MSNVDALEETLQVLGGLGRVEPVDAARVQVLRSLAAAVDEEPGKAALWQQYREALADLFGVDDAVDAGLADAIASLRSSSPLGH